MEITEHVDALEREGRALADAADRAGLDAPVPTCPGWVVRDLVTHTAGVHRWAASYVTTGRDKPWGTEDEAAFFVESPDAELVDAYRTANGDLVAALRGADPDLACWAFLPAPSPLAFWARRQAHEAAIHRADADAAAGSTPDFPPAFAADGVDELMRGFFSRRRGKLVADPPRSIAIAPDDADAAWVMRLRPDGRDVELGRSPADLTVTGSASALYLLLWNRVDETAVTLDGDREVLGMWRDLAKITWS